MFLKIYIWWFVLFICYLVFSVAQSKALIFYAMSRATEEHAQKAGPDAKTPNILVRFNMGMAWLFGQQQAARKGKTEKPDEFLKGKLFWINLHTAVLMIFMIGFIVMPMFFAEAGLDAWVEELQKMENTP